MTGPWHPVVPAAGDGRGHLRASDADREQVVDVLKAAFGYGLLTRDELDALAGLALTSRTYAELRAITSDIRLRPLQARPCFPPAAGAARRPVSRKTVAWCTSMMILAPAMGAAFLTYYGGFFVLLFLAFIGATATAQP